MTRILRSLLFSVMFCASSVASAQSVINDQTSTPTPGVGHDYIQMLGETVDPANGSLSLRLSIPVPPGRRLSLPFALSYSSNGAYVPRYSGSPGWIVWGPPTVPTGVCSFCGGWNHTAPLLTNSKISLLGGYIGNPAHRANCPITTGFIFHDVAGGQNTAGIAIKWGNLGCTSYPSVSYGGYDEIRSALIWNWGGVAGKTATAITSLDGTVYLFDNGTSVGSVPSFNIPTFVEDRNGNTLAFQPLGTSSKGDTGFSEIDTLGRTVLSVSTQSAGVPFTSVTVSGVGQPYTATWETITPSFVLN